MEIGEVTYWAKIALVVAVCETSLYFNDLYDFQVVRRRIDLLVHMMQALGVACVVLSVIYFLSPNASLGRGIAVLASPREANLSGEGKLCGATMAVGVSSSQSLLLQVGAGYRDQDPDRASSLGRCLLALGMSYLTHRVAPHDLLRGQQTNKQGIAP